jgi:glycerate 2-kinase
MIEKPAMITPLPVSARRIYESALAAVRPDRLVRAAVRLEGTRLEIQGATHELDGYAAVDVIALGKAAPVLAAALEDILGDRLRGGLVIGLPGAEDQGRRLRFLPGSHPLPDARSVAAGQAALELAAKSGSGDLLLLAASGGGSAMACVPSTGIRLADKTQLTAALLASGADIREMNIVRKHLSAIKGGRLAAAASSARVVNLLVSDVAGDDPGIIASGPGYPDESTFAEAIGVLEKFALWDMAVPAVRARFEAGRAGLAEETPKPGDRVLVRIETHLIGRNADALEAARGAAEALGFETIVRAAAETGEARAAARSSMAALSALASDRPRGSKPMAVLSGGEYTVRVRGFGRGGRNQEFVLASLLELGPFLDPDGLLAGRDWLVLSLGTDGIDGPTDSAGAWAGPETAARSRALGLDPRAFLDDNDSHSFFQAAGGLIATGPTGTNVMDVRLLLLA